ncbi:MAG: hypothetical protein A3C12_02465 [Candidatus Sungbacteria bacterium RIFCSPHIGHO2_02_FULL_49_20]|uniref:M23ase beta-sheet core domain-containing protein n=1 Tax=Candidatus Sungbacteria bacterium RIFCSPHIGHO2_02_FULL_49_20 TaxID=1802272 RepID=A0A1G2KNY5_9BACT|nr:MAG: hypothetical protein A3C12_02465 [Candidatus Sungbacteria bacterium RIFCSPHIGHO2_02_FULL_49_20]
MRGLAEKVSRSWFMLAAGGLALLSLAFLQIYSPIEAYAEDNAQVVTAVIDAATRALQQQIDAKTKEIQQLEALAQSYKNTIASTQSQSQTLKNKIQQISQTVNKLKTEIRLAQTQIARTNLEIGGLQSKIDVATIEIKQKQRDLGLLLQSLAASNEKNLVEVLLQYDHLSDFATYMQGIEDLQKRVYQTLGEVKILRQSLTDDKAEAEGKVKDLKRYTVTLADKKLLQTQEQQNQTQLLAETQNQEKKYQSLLSDADKKRRALEDEILDAERQLQYTISAGSLPENAAGVLGWPLTATDQLYSQCSRSVRLFLTQCFGTTAFSSMGAYGGKGHNGVDFRASVGSEVLAATAGTVRGIGDTDTACRRASYGKWILIDHDNNLTTLYAHLSLTKVSPGQHIERGDVIGYSGQTGYATGPHLHFSVFAKDAVEIGILRSRVCGRNMTLPMAPLNAYLDPLNYL